MHPKTPYVHQEYPKWVDGVLVTEPPEPSSNPVVEPETDEAGDNRPPAPPAPVAPADDPNRPPSLPIRGPDEWPTDGDNNMPLGVHKSPTTGVVADYAEDADRLTEGDHDTVVTGVHRSQSGCENATFTNQNPGDVDEHMEASITKPPGSINSVSAEMGDEDFMDLGDDDSPEVEGAPQKRRRGRPRKTPVEG